jgi:hypothetical protein
VNPTGPRGFSRFGRWTPGFTATIGTAAGLAAAVPLAGVLAAHQADAGDAELVPDMLANDRSRVSTGARVGDTTFALTCSAH